MSLMARAFVLVGLVFSATNLVGALPLELGKLSSLIFLKLSTLKLAACSGRLLICGLDDKLILTYFCLSR